MKNLGQNSKSHLERTTKSFFLDSLPMLKDFFYCELTPFFTKWVYLVCNSFRVLKLEIMMLELIWVCFVFFACFEMI